MNDVIIDRLLDILQPRLDILGLTREDVDLEQSLLQQGVMDSISFLEFVVSLEDSMDIELDISELEPEEFNSLMRLKNLIENAS